MKKFNSFLLAGLGITLMSITFSSCSKDDSLDLVSTQSRSIVQCKTVAEAC